MNARMRLLVSALIGVLLPVGSLGAQRYITVASTTSTEQSGLFKQLLPAFEGRHGIQVRVVALGTGQALDLGRRGDADVVFVHDAPAEEQFVAQGHGVRRHPVMYNDFVLLGPARDPAKVGGGRDLVEALRRIHGERASFVSRGDNSGTHVAEMRLWKLASIEPRSGRGAWYRETGAGMGPALNTAAAMGAYILADRGTWLSFRNRGSLAIAVEGDARGFNQYGVILVSPARHPHVKEEAARRFIDWLISSDGQAAIAAHGVDGEQLFFPNAR